MQRRSMFSAKEAPKVADVIPAKVTFEIDKRRKQMKEMSPHGKMLCALRKVLTDLSDNDEHGRRYFIKNDMVQMLSGPDGAGGKAGENRTYRATGRCRLGVTLPTGELTTKAVQFSITFRDTKDDRGLPDVVYIPPTTVDDLSGSGVNLSALD